MRYNEGLSTPMEVTDGEEGREESTGRKGTRSEDADREDPSGEGAGEARGPARGREEGGRQGGRGGRRGSDEGGRGGAGERHATGGRGDRAGQAEANPVRPGEDGEDTPGQA